jgi:hypothetical protein
MIEFRSGFQKGKEIDLMPDLIKTLKERNAPFDIIPSKKADEVSKKNAKALVLTSFIKTAEGNYSIQVKDKEFYRYTQKLLSDIFRLTITDIDKNARTVTAEGKYLGIMNDIIEVIALNPNYNLSIVYNGKI